MSCPQGGSNGECSRAMHARLITVCHVSGCELVYRKACTTALNMEASRDEDKFRKLASL